MTLSNRSMLVSLNQKIWSAASADRSIAMRVEKASKASHNTMRVVKHLAPPEYLLPIKRIATYGDDQHKRLTLPGIVKGQQLLSTKLFDEYSLIQMEVKDNFFQEVKRFKEVYPMLIETAPKRLGDAFRATDFPTVENIVDYFDYRIRFAPVPETGNWLLDDVDQASLSNLRNEVENQKNELFRCASKELFDRSKSVLENLMTQATTYVDGQGNGALLRDVTINAVKDMAQLITAMNITADPMLEVVADEMRKHFATMDARELRQNADKRSSIAETAKRLLAKMEA